MRIYEENNTPSSLLWGAHRHGGMWWQHRTAAYRKTTDNGIGNDNLRNTYRNNTARNGGRADRERKRAYPKREQGSGNQADSGRHRAYNSEKAKGRNQVCGNSETDRAIGGGKY